MKFIKFLFKFKFFKYLLGIIFFVTSIYFIIFMRKFFPENKILEGLGLLIYIIGFIYILYIFNKLIPDTKVQEEKGRKGTNPIAWLFKPTKLERKEMARQRRNAKARASSRSVSTLTKSGKYKSVKQRAADWKKFGKKK